LPEFLFNHIALSVKDVDESTAFYQKVFQFDEIQNTASNSKTRWLSLNQGKQLHLIPRPNSEIKVNKAVHFALSTPYLDLAISNLKKLELQFYDWNNVPDKVHVRKDGVRQIYFQDPNGYWIELNDAI
jgi:catechol 2,3-dioxygenase-like lactoylglutathione lyase family enzyme